MSLKKRRRKEWVGSHNNTLPQAFVVSLQGESISIKLSIPVALFLRVRWPVTLDSTKSMELSQLYVYGFALSTSNCLFLWAEILRFLPAYCDLSLQLLLITFAFNPLWNSNTVTRSSRSSVMISSPSSLSPDCLLRFSAEHFYRLIIQVVLAVWKVSTLNCP